MFDRIWKGLLLLTKKDFRLQIIKYIFLFINDKDMYIIYIMNISQKLLRF